MGRPRRVRRWGATASEGNSTHRDNRTNQPITNNAFSVISFRINESIRVMTRRRTKDERDWIRIQVKQSSLHIAPQVGQHRKISLSKQVHLNYGN